MGNKKNEKKYSKKKTNNMPNKSKDFNLGKVKACEQKHESYRSCYTHENGFEVIDEWISSNNRVHCQFAEVIVSYDRKSNTFTANKFTYGDYFDSDDDFIARSVKGSIEKAFKVKTDIDLKCIEDRLKDNKESLIIGYEICNMGPSKYIASLNKDYGAYDSLTFSESSCSSIKESLIKLNDKFLTKERVENKNIIPEETLWLE